MRNATIIKLGGLKPPTSFRLFKAGKNTTTKGTFIFDAEAAKAVMADFASRGVDLPIDVEHQSLDAAHADPTARDARGWFALEVRNGELWATKVRWAPDGEARLREKRQRYISPAFAVDAAGRVLSITNAALVTMPATHDTPALIAASTRLGDTTTMEPTLNDALAALEAGDAATALEIVKALIAAADNAPAEAEPASEPAEIAARATLMRLTATTSLAAAAAEVTALATERQQLAAERQQYDAAERIRLCVALVHAGRPPAAVWDQEAYKLGETPVPKPIYQRLSLAELRAHVAEEAKMRGPQRGGPSVRPPTTPGTVVLTPRGPVELTARQLEKCRKAGVDPARFAASFATSFAKEGT